MSYYIVKFQKILFNSREFRSIKKSKQNQNKTLGSERSHKGGLLFLDKTYSSIIEQNGPEKRKNPGKNEKYYHKVSQSNLDS